MYITLVLVFLTIAFTHAFFKRKADMSRLQLESDMVKELTITDLCLFTEAGYTRRCGGGNELRFLVQLI